MLKREREREREVLNDDPWLGRPITRTSKLAMGWYTGWCVRPLYYSSWVGKKQMKFYIDSYKAYRRYMYIKDGSRVCFQMT